MYDLARLFKVLSDSNRLRILMLVDRKELCVCQIMGIIGISQPLISQNLSILSKAGFLSERKDGKLKFYKVKYVLPKDKKAVMDLLRRLLSRDKTLRCDIKSLEECKEFQKLTGRCDMETFREFMRKKGGKV